jgi:hypothetical protein
MDWPTRSCCRTLRFPSPPSPQPRRPGRARSARQASGQVLAKKFLAPVAAEPRPGIRASLDALREADIRELAKAACCEADINYPVPRYMSPEPAPI